jgi:hypothetical protein
MSKKQTVQTGLVLPSNGATIPVCFEHLKRRVATEIKTLCHTTHYVYDNNESPVIYEVVATLSCLAFEVIQSQPLFDLTEASSLVKYLNKTQGTNANNHKHFHMRDNIFEDIMNEQQAQKYLLVRFVFIN